MLRERTQAGAVGGMQGGGGGRIAADRDTFKTFTTKKYRAAKTATLYHKNPV